MLYFIYQEREKNREKQITTGDNTVTISCHVSLRVEENTVVHLERRQKVRFCYLVAFHAPFKWHERHLLLACQQPFLFKNSKVNIKILKHPHANYTKYWCENTKILPMANGAGIQGLRKHEALLKNNLNPSSLLSCMFVLIHRTFFL